MKNVVQKTLQGWAGRLGAVAAGAACCLILGATPASAAGSQVTQLKYLQTLVQLSGESSQFNSSSKPSDYVNWAKSKNMNLGWDTKAKLSSSVMAQSLVQLYGLNPRKYGGDYYRILEREGILIEPDTIVTAEALAEFVSNPTVIGKTAQPSSTSPVKPGNGNGNGYGWYEHQAGIPKPPPPRGNGNGRGNLPKPR